jgi:hypothetical protein
VFLRGQSFPPLPAIHKIRRRTRGCEITQRFGMWCQLKSESSKNTTAPKLDVLRGVWRERHTCGPEGQTGERERGGHVGGRVSGRCVGSDQLP